MKNLDYKKILVLGNHSIGRLVASALNDPNHQIVVLEHPLKEEMRTDIPIVEFNKLPFNPPLTRRERRKQERKNQKNK